MPERRAEPVSEDAAAPPSLEQRIGDHLAVAFSLIILLYAAAGPISDAVHALIELTAGGFDALSRRERLTLMREHWLA